MSDITAEDSPEKLLNARERKAEQQLDELRTATQTLVAKGDSDTAFGVLFDVIQKLQRDNERLTFRLMAQARARYGRSSEKLNAEELGQLVLALGGTQQEAAKPDPELPKPDAPVENDAQNDKDKPDPDKGKKPKKKRPNHPGRTKLDPALPRDITFIPVPADERSCVHCHAEMQPIGYVDHETVEVIPAKIIVKVERRETVACHNKECKQDITTAPRGPSKQNERRAGFSLLADLLQDKTDDALPIYRQRDRLRRLGFDVPLNTLYGYWDYAAGLLAPLATAIVSTILGEEVVCMDDTKLDFLDRSVEKGIRRGHLWCMMGTSPLVAFVFTETWRAADIEPWISAIDGFIQVDDYKGYSSLFTDPDTGESRVLVPPDRRLGCLMHVRRRFHKAFKGGHLAGAMPLKLISDIYKVEDEAQQASLTAPQRLELRRAKSLPILSKFERWVDEGRETYLPTSPLGSACRYAKDQRPFIQRCFTDGRFELDTGRVEREIKEAAIGRKNFLFTGSVQGAERLADAFTVVLSARHAGLNVRAYLIDVLGKLAGGWKARRLTELLPANWERLHSGTSANLEIHEPL